MSAPGLDTWYDGPRAPIPANVGKLLSGAFMAPAARAKAEADYETYMATAFRLRKMDETDPINRALVVMKGAGVDELEDIGDALHAEFGDLAERCLTEQSVFDYAVEAAGACGRHDIRKAVRLMDGCHHAGSVGYDRGLGKFVRRYDHKCEKTKLCPHAARAESARLIDYHAGNALEWLNGAPNRRLVYAVFTIPNAPQGELRESITGERGIIAEFNRWRTHDHDYSPLNYSKAEGLRPWGKRKPAPRSIAGSVQGALVTVECPLGKAGDWNTHLNALLLIEGPFDYAAARQVWGRNVYFQEIDPRRIRSTLVELIKYAAKLVNPRDGGDDAAPPLIEWPHRAFCEWFDAMRGLRRTRTYGCLYAYDGKRWAAADIETRGAWIASAHTYDPDVPYALALSDRWRDLPPEYRDTIKRAMRDGERVTEDLVAWLTRFMWTDWGRLGRGEAGFQVGSIPGNNSGVISGIWYDRETLAPVAFGDRPGTGPP